MTKLSELTNIKPRNVLIQYIPNREGLPLLHICRRQGDDGGLSRNLTNCGRVLDYYNIYTEPSIEDNVATCPRCGKPEDFKTALQDYWTWWSAWKQEMDRKEKELAAENERVWQAYIRELERVQDSFDEIYPTVLDKKNGRLVIQTSEYEEEWLQVVKYRKDWS